MEKPKEQKCKVMYKGVERKGVIIETKVDKVKVFIGEVNKSDWYDRNNIKRYW